MHKSIATALVAFVVFVPSILVPSVAAAQDRWHWEVRSGVAEPVRTVREADLDTGVEFQGTVSVTFAGGFGMYTGLGLNTFQSDTSFAGRDRAFTDRGYVLGLQWHARFAESRMGLRLRAGATYGEIRITEDDYDDDITDSNHGLGWEVGIALTISLPNQWMLTPGIRYRELSRNIRFNGVKKPVDLEYAIVGIGFGRSF